MDSSVSFHQQIKGRIFLIAFLFSISFIALLAALFQSESALVRLKHQTLPTIEKQISDHRLILESEQLLTQLLMTKNPQKFDVLLPSYQKSLQTIISNNTKDKLLATRLLAELAPFLASVSRLSVNHEKNEQLKQSAIVQLQLVNTALSDALATGTLTQQVLHQQSINLFSQAIIMLENLSIATDIERFTHFTDQLNALIQRWIVIITKAKETISPSVAASLAELNNLLWVEQRSIAKWRSHIRINQEFIALMNLHHQTLLPLTQELPSVALTPENIWPKALLPWLPPQVKTSIEAYYITIASIFTALVLLLLLLQFLLYKRIKRYQRHSTSLIKQRIKGEVNLPVTSREQHESLPHHKQTLIWRTNKLSSSCALTLREMLGLKNSQCWYHAFPREVSKKILADARAAKRDGCIIDTIVKDKQGRTFGFTLEYVEKCWQGTLTTQEHQAKFEQELALLAQMQSQTEHNERLQRIENSQKLSKRLIRAMLQSQSASLGYGVTSTKVYRHLVRMLEWAKQIQLITILDSKDRQVQLTDVSFTHELCALVTNAIVDANLQRNTISYTVDSNIIEPCKLNVQLFHQTFSHFYQTLLNEQFKGHLHFGVSMVDKNSGQQILNFSFTVTHQENSAVVPETVATLAQIDEQQIEKSSSTTQYFYQLFKAMFCEPLQIKTVDNGYQVSFNIPITTAVSSQLPQDIVDLNQRNILLLSNDSLTISAFDLLAKKHQAMLSTMANMKLFTQQVSVKNLTKKALAVVIISGDIFKNDFDFIYQHITALPKKLQPKILVLQPLCNQAFHRVGFFEHTQCLLNTPTFAKSLKQFVKSDNDTNLLLEKDIFQQYRFASTQVEVLLAITKPEQHEVLQRLLHWMGLQVHLVCNQAQMLKEWGSGRYLILLNEFDVSPLINLEVGKKVKRSVYVFSTPHLTQYQKEVTEECSHWEFTLLPNILDIAALVKVFSPWLKEQQCVHNANASLESPKSKLKSKPTPKKAHVLQDKKITAVTASVGAFDLVKYAHNQGSSELAAFMLIDYIKEIENNIAQLAQSIADKQSLQAEHALAEIIKIAKIIVAHDLLQSCRLIKHLLTAQDFKGCNEAVLDIQKKYQLLAEYAQAI